MITNPRIFPPNEWQAFELLCLKLWGEIWEIKNDIELNSSNSQGQDGVDIYGIPRNKNKYFGIQCKNFKQIKKSGNKNKLIKSNIDEIINKAETFEPYLQKLIIATSLEKDKEIETYIRKINIDRITQGKFSIQICFWDYITRKIFEYEDVYNWYLKHENFHKEKSVDIYFNNYQSSPYLIEYSPKFLKIVKEYRLETTEDLEEEKLSKENIKEIINSSSKNRLRKYFYNFLSKKKFTKKNLSDTIFINGIDINSKEYKKSLYPKQKINQGNIQQFNNLLLTDDLQPLSFRLVIENNGSSIIEDYKVRLDFEGILNTIEVPFPRLSRLNTYKPNTWVFDNKSGFIKPEKNLLVQKDYFITEKIILFPNKDLESNIRIKWKLISRDYNDSGSLNIKISPQYEQIITEYLVLNKEDCKIEEEIKYNKFEYIPIINY